MQIYETQIHARNVGCILASSWLNQGIDFPRFWQEKFLRSLSEDAQPVEANCSLKSSRLCSFLDLTPINVLYIIDLSCLQETIVKFLEFVTQSLESFAESNIDGSLHSPPNKIYDSSSDECNLVSSMIGIITNIAATPLGRDYLSSKTLGVKTLDSLIMYLSEMPTRQCHTIKNLILKSLFNVR